MCLAKVYLNKDSAAPIMQEISRMKFDGERIEIETLFGEAKVVTGKVREIDFMASKVILDSDDTANL